jgi:putative cardiolipin synthase
MLRTNPRRDAPIRLAVLVATALSCSCTALEPAVHRGDGSAPIERSATSLNSDAAAERAARAGLSGVRILDTGLDAFTERAALIEAAERTIDAQYYIWNSDLTGAHLAERLYAAAERGVRVRLLLDDVNVAGRDAVIAALDTHPNLEVRIYNPFVKRKGLGKALGFLREFARLNRRMHNKSFTVDGAVAIIGGRNIGDEYFDADLELNFRDRDVVAIGPVVEQVDGMFELFWSSALAYPIAQLTDAPLSPTDGAKRLDRVRSQRDALAQLGLPVVLDESSARPLVKDSWRRMTWAPATLVHDVPPAPDAVAESDTPQPTARALGALARAAERDVLIESAYLVMDETTLAGIAAIRARGVPVRALTNSLASNDVFANHAAYARRRKGMVEAGVELWELRPDAASCGTVVAVAGGCDGERAMGLHAKTFVFDRRTVYVGSLNLNLRSTYLNAETAMIIESPTLAEEVAASIETNLAFPNSWRVEIDGGRGVTWNDAQNRFRHEPATSWWLRTKAGFVALFPLEKYL